MNKLDLLQKESSSVSLHEEERKQLRDSLMSYMEKTPIIAPDSSLETTFAKPSPYSKWLVLAVIAGLIVASTGISYAAQSALPGSALYPVKVGINEKIRTYFAFSDSSKAKVEADLAAERLKEAEALKANASLTDQTSTSLRADFNAHLAAYENSEKKLEVENNDDAKNVDTAFKTSMHAHASILPALSIENNFDTKADATTTIKNQSSESTTTTSVLTKVIAPPIADASTTADTHTEVNTKKEVPNVHTDIKTDLKAVIQ